VTPNDSSDDWDADPPMNSFEEWLEQQTQDGDVSKEELFQQLLSAYWTLKEMGELLDETTQNNPLFTEEEQDQRQGAEETPQQSDAPQDPQSRPRREPWRRGRPSKSRDPSRPREPSRRREEPAPRDHERTPREYERTPRDHERAVTQSQVDDLRERLEELKTELQGDLADLEDGLGNEAERGSLLASEIRILTEWVEELEHQLADVDSTSESEVNELRAEINELESRVSAKQTKLRTRLEAEFDDLRSQLESRLEAEFDDLETILGYLVDTSDELEDVLARTRRRYQSDVGDLRELITTLQARGTLLQRLLREATDKGVQSARCEHCDEEVDLSLLSRPNCPACESLFTGIDEKRKWFLFADPVLTTGGSDDVMDHADVAHDHGEPEQLGASDRRAGHEPEPDPEPSTSDRDRGQAEGDASLSSPDLTLDLPSDSDAEESGESSDIQFGDPDAADSDDGPAEPDPDDLSEQSEQ